MQDSKEHMYETKADQLRLYTLDRQYINEDIASLGLTLSGTMGLTKDRGQ